MVANIADPRARRIRDILRAGNGARRTILILDGVRLTGNIGALTRTAAAFDAAGIVLVNSGLISVYDRRLIRASRGLVFSLPVVTASRHDVPAFLVESDATLVALSVQAVDPVAGLANLPGRVAVLLGSERTGASPQLEAAATHRFSVPINAAVESLNVSVAGALALYERLHRAA